MKTIAILFASLLIGCSVAPKQEAAAPQSSKRSCFQKHPPSDEFVIGVLVIINGEPCVIEHTHSEYWKMVAEWDAQIKAKAGAHSEATGKPATEKTKKP